MRVAEPTLAAEAFARRFIALPRRRDPRLLTVEMGLSFTIGGVSAAIQSAIDAMAASRPHVLVDPVWSDSRDTRIDGLVPCGLTSRKESSRSLSQMRASTERPGRHRPYGSLGAGLPVASWYAQAAERRGSCRRAHCDSGAGAAACRAGRTLSQSAQGPRRPGGQRSSRAKCRGSSTNIPMPRCSCREVCCPRGLGCNGYGPCLPTRRSIPGSSRAHQRRMG